MHDSSKAEHAEFKSKLENTLPPTTFKVKWCLRTNKMLL
jgi:hypothetical protein